MATGKRYYWMKLKESFMTSDTIDYFMSQPNGANYVVLYQMLCLKTINTNGRLSRQIGEVIIPYDIPKIQRDLKYFTADTIRVALGLYKSFGLIYEDQDGVLVLTDHDNLVGSETNWAAQKRNQKNNRSLPVPKGGQQVETSVENFHPDIEIDIRDRERSSTPARTREEEDLGKVMSFIMDRLNPMPSPLMISDVKHYIEKLEPDVIIHAVSLGLDEKKTSWSYIKAILQRYVREGKTTMLAIRDEEAQRQQDRSSRRGGKQAIPDYNTEEDETL